MYKYRKEAPHVQVHNIYIYIDDQVVRIAVGLHPGFPSVIRTHAVYVEATWMYLTHSLSCRMSAGRLPRGGISHTS